MRSMIPGYKTFRAIKFLSGYNSTSRATLPFPRSVAPFSDS